MIRKIKWKTHRTLNFAIRHCWQIGISAKAIRDINRKADSDFSVGSFLINQQPPFKKVNWEQRPKGPLNKACYKKIQNTNFSDKAKRPLTPSKAVVLRKFTL